MPCACRWRTPRSLAAGSRGPRRSSPSGRVLPTRRRTRESVSPSFGQDDILFDAILRDGKINVAKVHGDFDGLFERAGLGGLQKLLDCLDRVLVRQGKSPPAVCAAARPPAEER